MTREEITSYRPAQDPAIDPSQGQCPVQVSTDLVEEARPPPPPPVMSTAEIAAYRSAEDPAYDPVQRRGWWEVDMTQGTPLAAAACHAVVSWWNTNCLVIQLVSRVALAL